MRLMKNYILSQKLKVTVLLGLGYLSNSMVLHIPQAHAQQANWQGGARGTAARAIGQRWKVGVGQANLYAGPSVAYSKRGRVYEGEQLTILEVTRSQEWAQVSAPSGVRGWIKVSALNRPQDQIAQDSGRYRRQSEYQYDAQGRRVNMNGQAVGSGQGTGAQGQRWDQDRRPQQRSQQAPARDWRQRPTQNSSFDDRQRYEQTQYNDGYAPVNGFDRSRASSNQSVGYSKLSLSLPVGISHFTRRFASDVGTSPLSGLTSQVISPSVGLIINSQVNNYVSLSARYMKTIGGEAPLPSLASLPEVGAVDLPTSQQAAELVVGVGTHFDVAWADNLAIKGLVGGQYYDSVYTPVQYPEPATKMAPLQDHSYISALLGLELCLQMKPIRWSIKGGGALPLSFEQSPNSEGQWNSLGIWTQSQIDFAIGQNWSLGLMLSYMRIASDYTGPAEHADYTLNEPVYYTQASGYDQNIEALLVMGYSL